MNPAFIAASYDSCIVRDRASITGTCYWTELNIVIRTAHQISGAAFDA